MGFNSGFKGLKKKPSIEHWWNDTDWEENEVTRGKSDPMPHNPYGLTMARTQDAEVKNLQLTALLKAL